MKKQSRKMISMSLAAALALTSMPLSAFAEDTVLKAPIVEEQKEADNIVTDKENIVSEETEYKDTIETNEQSDEVKLETEISDEKVEEEITEDKYAENATITINSSEDLVNAIKNQKDGQTWVVAAGEYDVNPAGENVTEDYDAQFYTDLPEGKMVTGGHDYKNEKFIFPIYADNLTIKAADGVEKEDISITSSAVPSATDGGNWTRQSFIIISGKNVTIDGVTLVGNINEYNDNDTTGLWGKQCDKTIETVNEASDFTLKNVVFAPIQCDTENELYIGTQRSGSLYISANGNGTTTLENVTMYGGIKVANGVSLEVSNVVQDFRNNTYGIYEESTKDYAWNAGIRSTGEVTVKDGGFILVVDDSVDSRQIFSSGLVDGTNIELESDISLETTVNINKDITINGNRHTINGNNITATNSKIDGFLVESGTVTFNDINLINFDNNADASYGSVIKIDNGNTDAKVIANNVNISGFVRDALTFKAGSFEVNNCTIDCKPGEHRPNKLTKGFQIGFNSGKDIVSGTINGTTVSNSTSNYEEWSTSAIELFNNADVEITNCTIKDTKNGIHVDNYWVGGSSYPTYTGDVNVDISNTNIVAEDAAIRIYSREDQTNSANVNITSGTYTGDIKIINGTENDKINITGGTFSNDPSAYIPDGIVANKNESGNWVVSVDNTERENAIRIGYKWYQSADEISKLINEGIPANSTVEIYGKVEIPFTKTNSIIPGGNYFAVTSDNVTIKGMTEDAELCYASDEVIPNGNWGTQSFVLITGDNVTIENVNIKPQAITENGDTNKTVEFVGKNITMKNCKITPNTNTIDGGGLYLNGDKGIVLVENCTFEKAYICLDSVDTAESISIKNNTFNTPCSEDTYIIGNVSWENPINKVMAPVTVEGNTFKGLPDGYDNIILQRMEGNFTLLNNKIDNGKNIIDMVKFGNIQGADTDKSEMHITIIESGKTTIVTNSENENPNLTEFAISAPTNSIYVNNSLDLKATITDKDEDLSSVTWKVDGKVVEESNESYKFTADAVGEYRIEAFYVYGDIPCYASFDADVSKKSSGGGSSSSSGGSSSSSSETTTEIDSEGTKTETVTTEDGTVTTTIEKTDGTTSTTTVNNEGDVKSEVNVSKEAVKENEVVSLPMPSVNVTKDIETAPVVKVEIEENETAKVEIPVENMTAGTVAVLVKEDGTEEVIKTSLEGENGLLITVEGNATIKVVDNSKDFADVSFNFWGSEAVDFATSREIFAGTSETTFSPDNDMTRAMIITVLARFDGQDTTGGSTWYEQATDWAMANGISDGTNLNGSVTREQLASMLYRYAGSPEVTGSINNYTDVSSISGYATDAMTWAVEQGLISGMGDGTLNPQGEATRAQVATIMMNFMKNTNK